MKHAPKLAHLVAAHDLTWCHAVELAEQHRLDPQYLSRLSGNGIALNALHDKAFDRGLITFDTELRLVCAPSLCDHFADATVGQHFKAYEGKPLAIPAEAPGPKPEQTPSPGSSPDYGGQSLAWRRAEVFGKQGPPLSCPNAVDEKYVDHGRHEQG